jgi:hypothetical protein
MQPPPRKPVPARPPTAAPKPVARPAPPRPAAGPAKPLRPAVVPRPKPRLKTQARTIRDVSRAQASAMSRRSMSSSRSSRWIWVTAGLLVLVAALAGTVAVVLKKKPPPETTVVEQPKPPEPARDVEPSKPKPDPLAEADALAQQGDLRGARDLLQKALDGPEMAALTPRDPRKLRLRERIDGLNRQIQAAAAERAGGVQAFVDQLNEALTDWKLEEAEAVLAKAEAEVGQSPDLEEPRRRLTLMREAKQKLDPLRARAAALTPEELGTLAALEESPILEIKLEARRLAATHKAKPFLEEGRKLLEERIRRSREQYARLTGAGAGEAPAEGEGAEGELWKFFMRPRIATALDPLTEKIAEALPEGDRFEKLCRKVESLELDGDLSYTDTVELDELAEELGALPQVHFLRAAGLYIKQDYRGSAEAAARAVEREPRFGEAWLLSARVAMERNRLEDSERALDKAFELLPDLPDICLNRALLHIYRGRSAQAEAQLALALKLAPKDVGLQGIVRQLRGVIKGPTFSIEKPFEARTKHYLVRTDISQETADDFAGQLEAMRSHYAAVLGAEAKQDYQVPVLIFKQRKEFQRYGGMPPGVLGYYSPIYRQFVFYDLSSDKRLGRDGFIHVMFHEGFHQYVREVIPNIPRWLNEAMAEYASSARVVDGKVTGAGSVDKALITMRLGSAAADGEQGWVPRLFGKGAYYHPYYWGYDNGWGLIHFLYQYEGGRHIKGYLEALRKGESPREAALLSMPAQEDHHLVYSRWAAHLEKLKKDHPKPEEEEAPEPEKKEEKP